MEPRRDGQLERLQQSRFADARQFARPAAPSNTANEIVDIAARVAPAWATPAYDRNGNMTSIPEPATPSTATFPGVFDAWNRLVGTDGRGRVWVRWAPSPDFHSRRLPATRRLFTAASGRCWKNSRHVDVGRPAIRLGPALHRRSRRPRPRVAVGQHVQRALLCPARRELECRRHI